MVYPIKILHVIGIMNRGGAETFIMNLYRSIDRSKVQFDFVEGSNQSAAYDQEIMELGGRVYRCPRFNGKNLFAYRKWWNDFFKEHASEYVAVHGHIGSTAAIYLSIAKKYGLQTIAHSHGEYGKLSFKQTLYKGLSYPTRYISDDFFTCSEAAGTDRFGKKVSLKYIRNGIDTEQFRYNTVLREEMKNEFGWNDCIIFGHVGRFTAEKNHKKILDIFRRINSKNERTRLVLVGDGPLKEELERYADSIGVSKNVCFTGVRSDVNRLLNGMDVLIFPSIHEGLPVTLVEAQCTGLKCLISDCITNEAVMDPGLITFKSIQDSDETWAEEALKLADYVRKDGNIAVKEKEFDIEDTAKELQEYYCSLGERHE